MDLHDELDDFVAPPVDVNDEPPLDPLNEVQANGMLRRLRRLSRDRAKVQSVARAEIDQIEAWQRDRLATIDAEMEHLSATCEQWMRMHKLRTETSTKKFPHGELRLRKAPEPGIVEVVDSEKVNAFAIERVMTSIARNLADEGFADRKLNSSDVWSLAFSHLMAEPLLRVKVELAAGELRRIGKPGPIKSEHEDVEMRSVVIDGEEVPGVLFERSKRDRFGMTLATVEPEAPEQEDEDVNRG